MKDALTRRGLLTGVAAATALLALRGKARAEAIADQVTLLHTNDTHSRLEPFEKGSLAGLGGIARRAAMIRKIRAAQPNTLVLDAGDTFQGTPYFNAFAGQAEFETMTAAGYDFSTLGNHDFDKGVDGLVAAMQYAKFDFVNANYDIDPPGLRARVKPYAVRVVGGRRIGLFGLGVSFKNLVASSYHAGIRYLDPVKASQAMVQKLRQDEGVDAVVLISHLGYYGHEEEPGDPELAQAVPGIDIIIGGHTHTFMAKPHVVSRPDGTATYITQVGFAGTHLGQIDLLFPATGGVHVTTTVHAVSAAA